MAFDALVEVESPDRFETSLRARLVSRDDAFQPRAGERWRLLLSLRPPQGRANPGAQDYERQLFRERVHALGTVLPSGINRRLDAGHRPLTELRERISRHISAQIADRDAAALIAALAVGDTGGVSREQWRVFHATGTTHLVAISGLHVTLFAVVAFAIARRLWWPMPTIPRETFAAVLGFGAATAYATLAGLSVPTQRTLIMLGAWLLARSVARTTRPFQPFALALLAVLLLDPFAPLSAGFWLSFAAMAAIIVVTAGHFIRRPLLREALAVQVVVTIALLPFSLALFGSVSVIGPLVNALAIPAMSWVLVPTVLLAVVLLPISEAACNWVLAIAAWFQDAGWPWLAAAADVPWALIHASPPWWWYILAMASVGMAAMPWPLMLRLAALVCAIPLVAGVDRAPQTGSAEITILDVGEGTSVVVRTAEHVLVYGTGDSYGTNGRMAESVLVPFLRAGGVRAIDRLVLGRASPATGSGVAALLAELPVRETLVEEASGEEGELECAEVGPWEWDGITFELLRSASHACVLTVGAKRGRVLIPGDVDANIESELATSTDLRAHVVLVPRSGSDAASSRQFIDAMGARWAVVSGRRMQRSSPKRALFRWEEGGAQVLSTAELGAIRFRIDTATGVVGPDPERADRRTLWAASP
jgi:competence protein ComEC